MATKRRPRRIPVASEEQGNPSRWRLQHGDVEQAAPEPDAGAHRHRAVDTLGQMLKNGTITPEMHKAGIHFRHLFRMAQLGSIGVSSLVRTAGVTPPGPSDHHITAGLRVAEAMDVLGGHDSAAGSCAWHVLGCQSSVREWSMRQGWGGRVVPAAQAQGMLTATLAVLARHFRLDGDGPETRERPPPLPIPSSKMPC
jgi:hypothetical protein